MEPIEGLRALHRRREKDGHDQQGDLQPLPTGAPQCRGDRCSPGRSELRGDRRGGEPATRAESADAEAARGCGRPIIVNLKDGKPTERRRNGIDERPLVRPRRLMSMSAFGTKRTWRSRLPMSAFGGKADVKPVIRIGRYRASYQAGPTSPFACKFLARELVIVTCLSCSAFKAAV